jgi:hypothetical protein
VGDAGSDADGKAAVAELEQPQTSASSTAPMTKKANKTESFTAFLPLRLTNCAHHLLTMRIPLFFLYFFVVSYS